MGKSGPIGEKGSRQEKSDERVETGGMDALKDKDVISKRVRLSVFANGQSVQSTVVPRWPSPVGGLGKARLQSYRPWEQQFGLTIVRLQSAHKYRGCYLKILNTTVAGCGRQMGISLNRKV